MPIQTVTQRNTLATSYGAAALFGALYSTAPGAAAGTELTGGAPAYARKSLAWGAAAASAITAVATFDVASGSSVVGTGAHTALTLGTYLDGVSVTTQSFASQGTYQVTYTYTQS